MDILEFIKEKKEELLQKKKDAKEKKEFNKKIEDFFKASYFLPIAQRNQNEADRSNSKESKLVGQKPDLYSDDIEHAWVGHGWESLKISGEKNDLIVRNYTRGVSFTLKKKNNESIPLSKEELKKENDEGLILSWVSQKYNYDMMKYAHDIDSNGNNKEILEAIDDLLPSLKKEYEYQNKLIEENKNKKKSSRKLRFK